MKKRPNLKTATETQLLTYVQAILTQIGELTLQDKYELIEINDEFIRREQAKRSLKN